METVEKFTCSICEEEFDAVTHLAQHLKTHITANQIQSSKMDEFHDGCYQEPPMKDNEFQCDICKNKFSSDKNLNEHIMNIHGESKNYPCHLCDKSFTCKQSRYSHKKMKHDAPTHQCMKCPKTFAMSTFLKDHLARAHKIGDFLCGTCDKVFPRSAVLKSHICKGLKNDIKIKNYKCEKCGKAFLQKQLLKLHNKNKHNGEYKSNKSFCSICNEHFSKKALFRTHKKEIHGESKIFDCAICDQCFSAAVSLSKHKKQNHGFACKRCDKKFVKKLQLRVHKRIHKGEKNTNSVLKVGCNICKKVLANQFCFKQHMLVVHKDEQFANVSCDICDKKFMYESFKLTHIKIEHEGFRETCELCDKTFAQKGALKLHVSKIHQEIAK